jgi:hypothetical protein
MYVLALVTVSLTQPAIAKPNCALNPDAPVCGGDGGDSPKPKKPPSPQSSPSVADSGGLCTALPLAAALFPRETTQRLKVQPDGSVLTQQRQPLTSVPDKMWNSGQTLRVSIAGSGATNTVKAKIQQYATEWSKYANIQFRFVNSAEESSKDAEIRVNVEAYDEKATNEDGTPKKPGPNWSRVGRDATTDKNATTMNFGGFNDRTAETTFRAIILHEFGHALGLIHEHQSPEAGIAWDTAEVYRYFENTYGWDKNLVDSNVLEVAKKDSTNYSQFDSRSIMAYSIPASLTTNRVGIPGNTQLSDVDKEFIRKWYPVEPDVSGTLQTRDCGDVIPFTIQNNVYNEGKVKFVLQPGSGITWWKSLKVPMKNGGFKEIEIQDGSSNETEINVEDIDAGRPIVLSKAKFLGEYTEVRNWRILPALTSRSKVTLTWIRDDGCGFGEGIIIPPGW